MFNDSDDQEPCTEESLLKDFPDLTGVHRADAAVFLSQFAYEREEFEATLALCESAIELYENFSAITYSENITQAHRGKMYSLTALERHEESALAAERAAVLARFDGPSDAAEVFRAAGLSWFKFGDYARSISCYELALLEPDTEVTDYKIAIDFYNMGMAYVEIKEWLHAGNKFNVAKKYFQLSGNPELSGSCVKQLAKIRRKDPERNARK
jgi:tetratricopeptide (TPR) repeat protein